MNRPSACWMPRGWWVIVGNAKWNTWTFHAGVSKLVFIRTDRKFKDKNFARKEGEIALRVMAMDVCEPCWSWYRGGREHLRLPYAERALCGARVEDERPPGRDGVDIPGCYNCNLICSTIPYPEKPADVRKIFYYVYQTWDLERRREERRRQREAEKYALEGRG